MTIALIKKSDGQGVVKGIIRDSVSLNGVAGLKLTLRKGFNNTEGDKVGKPIETKSDGSYRFKNVDIGYYCIEIQDGGDGNYINTVLNVVVTKNSDRINQDGIVSKAMNGDQMRIVLTWNDSVGDLDSHMTGISENFHVYFGNKTYENPEGELKAELDVDDTYYYGLETITVYDDNISFKYYVHNFSGGNKNVLSGSEATVQIYIGNSLVDVYHIPSEEGYAWDVFSYNGKTGIIKPLGKMH